MHLIPLSTKYALFNKGGNDPLTPDEQALWDEFVEWERPVTTVVDPDEPVFIDALKIYTYFQEENIAPWEKVQAIISQDRKAPEIVETGDLTIATDRTFVPIKNNVPFKWLAPVAVALVIFIFGGWLFNRLSAPPSALVTVNTTTQKKDSFLLPDGSLVWLNTTTSLQYFKNPAGNGRSVALVGEGYFKVKSDSLNPFTVKIGGVEVVARGTEFNVKGTSDSAVITLKEGKLLIKINNGDSIKIESGEQAVVKRNTISKWKTTNEDKLLEWKKTFIILQGQTTQSVMEQIHTYYQIDYTIQAGLPPLALTGRLSTENPVDSTIKFLNDAADKIRFDLINKRIIVRKK